MFYALLAAALLLPAGVDAEADSPIGEGWELAYEDGDVRVHRRYAHGTGVVETLTVASVKAPPREVFRVLTDCAGYPEFMPHFVECRVLSHSGNVQLMFQRLRISEFFRFLFKDRFHVVRNVTQTPEEGQSHYRIEWSLDAATMRGTRVDDAVPTRLNTGYWELREVDGGSATRIRYYLVADPGGSIPRSFANEGTVQSIPAVIAAVRSRVQSRLKQSAPFR